MQLNASTSEVVIVVVVVLVLSFASVVIFLADFVLAVVIVDNTMNKTLETTIATLQ